MILALKEMNQRCKEFNMTQDKWYAVWILGRIRKRKIMDNSKFQALRDVVKKGGEGIVEKFEKKFKDIKIEGKRRSAPSVMYSDHVPDKLPDTFYTEMELEAMYMGTESEARKRFQTNGSFQRRQSFNRWLSLLS